MAKKYDKIWIEVDVEPDRDPKEKTRKMGEIMTALSENAECVQNITKIQYQIGRNWDDGDGSQ